VSGDLGSALTGERWYVIVEATCGVSEGSSTPSIGQCDVPGFVGRDFELAA
jgi:hypothetical protein